VLEVGPSIELCGGTHVSASGDIGLLKVTSESSIGSNLRRIEAITGAASVELLQSDERRLAEIGQLVGSAGGDVVGGVQRKLDEIKALQGELKQLRSQLASGRAFELAAAAVDGVVVQRVDGVEPGELRDLAIAVRQQGGRRVVLIGVTPTGGVSLVAAVRPGEGVEAADLIKSAAKAVGGGGGGKGDIATAGGKDATAIDEAMRIATESATAAGST
jgi:alanyl-tRNA synthetase